MRIVPPWGLGKWVGGRRWMLLGMVWRIAWLLLEERGGGGFKNERTVECDGF
jgi:hypothetical protein